jgi:2-polyprenyl-3-methyl-5-hydroxy-6-metoxy-1,4-benzoquinol methylase
MKHSHIHGFNPSQDYPDYEQCQECGTLHRIKDVAPKSIYESGYWDRSGFSNLQEQVYNVSEFKNEAGLTKVEAVMQYAGKGTHALELACAPGSLLKALRANYDHVVGVETDPRYHFALSEIIAGHAALVFGFFPEVSKHWPSESFDFIVGMDLLEHIADPEEFMTEILRLLKPDGTVVLMSPFQGKEPLDEGQFMPEHILIFSEDFIREWFSEMFEEVVLSKWIHNHNIVVGKRKKMAQPEHYWIAPKEEVVGKKPRKKKEST